MNRAKRKTKSGNKAQKIDSRLHEQQVNHVLFPLDSLAQIIEQNKRLEKDKKAHKTAE